MCAALQLQAYFFALKVDMRRPSTELAVKQMGGLEYRLGDLVHGYFDRLNVTHLFCAHWPQSIGCAYTRQRRRTPDYSVLRKLTQGGEVPPRNALKAIN